MRVFTALVLQAAVSTGAALADHCNACSNDWDPSDGTCKLSTYLTTDVFDAKTTTLPSLAVDSQGNAYALDAAVA